MARRHSNLFCAPSPAIGGPVNPSIEWSSDGATWFLGSPAEGSPYLRVTAPAGVDVSAAASVVVGSLGGKTATVAGQVVTISGAVPVPAGSYDLTVLDGSAGVLFDAGILTVI